MFETYGGIAPLPTTLLGHVVTAYASLHNASLTPFIQFSANQRARLSVTLQRGNALVSHMGLLHARGIHAPRLRAPPGHRSRSGLRQEQSPVEERASVSQVVEFVPPDPIGVAAGEVEFEVEININSASG